MYGYRPSRHQRELSSWQLVPIINPIGSYCRDWDQMWLTFTKGRPDVGGKFNEQESWLVLWGCLVLSIDDVPAQQTKWCGARSIEYLPHIATSPVDQFGLRPEVACEDHLTVTGKHYWLGKSLGLVWVGQVCAGPSVDWVDAEDLAPGLFHLHNVEGLGVVAPSAKLMGCLPELFLLFRGQFAEVPWLPARPVLQVVGAASHALQLLCVHRITLLSLRLCQSNWDIKEPVQLSALPLS